MKEKEVWTLLGRKKVFLVDDDNCIVEELKDLGPLSETEMKWVKANSDKAYQEWLESIDLKNEEGDETQD
jgi:hypothetical protein